MPPLNVRMVTSSTHVGCLVLHSTYSSVVERSIAVCLLQFAFCNLPFAICLLLLVGLPFLCFGILQYTPEATVEVEVAVEMLYLYFYLLLMFAILTAEVEVTALPLVLLCPALGSIVGISSRLCPPPFTIHTNMDTDRASNGNEFDESTRSKTRAAFRILLPRLCSNGAAGSDK